MSYVNRVSNDNNLGYIVRIRNLVDAISDSKYNTLNNSLTKTIHHAVHVTSTEAELFIGHFGH